MLQRSPTYIVARPSRDPLATMLRRFLPTRAAFAIARWYFVLFGMYFFDLCRRKPAAVKQWIINQARLQLGPGHDVKTHFTPSYDPWRQRLCLAPDADFFRAIKAGTASVVTGSIATFTERGIRLASGEELEADIIITATGLRLLLLGAIDVTVDGRRAELSQAIHYKGVMFSDLPNLFNVFGYTNASWTLKSDLACSWAARVINHMDQRGQVVCAPRLRDPSIRREPMTGFVSGYFQRVINELPQQGSKRPWKLHQNYVSDFLSLRYGTIADDALEFSSRAEPGGAKAPARDAA
jgi:cation diffusion facilitator CzcD-associated flavoprotein CzcO